MGNERNAGRVIVERRADGVRIAILPSRSAGTLFFVAFVGFWLFMWMTAFTQIDLPAETGGFWLVWLVGWSSGAIIATSALLWVLFGREDIELNSVRLTYRPSILGLGVLRSYDVATISDLRRFDDPAKAQLPLPMPWIYKRIAFDSGPRTVRMADNVSDAEANHAIAAMKEAVKALR